MSEASSPEHEAASNDAFLRCIHEGVATVCGVQAASGGDYYDQAEFSKAVIDVVVAAAPPDPVGSILVRQLAAMRMAELYGKGPWFFRILDKAKEEGRQHLKRRHLRVVPDDAGGAA